MSYLNFFKSLDTSSFKALKNLLPGKLFILDVADELGVFFLAASFTASVVSFNICSPFLVIVLNNSSPLLDFSLKKESVLRANLEIDLVKIRI